MKTTAGPYAPGGRPDALAFTVSVIVTPLVSVTPKVELAVSQDGVLIEYLTVPVEALTRHSISEGENGPPSGPEKVMLVESVTIKDGPADLCAAPICVDNSVTGMQRNAIKAIRLVTTPTLNICSSSRPTGYENCQCVLL